MIIKKIKLHNIRSYLDETVELPMGSVLLSGDIGSGKSTVLLAIEFALFGLQRGIMEGSALLRNDRNESFVELELEIAKHSITIKRSLKRTKDSVMQSSASLVVDGKRKELTATELKSFILEILNYPASLLTKKSLIYRYTVYTPQEEMKQIMLENAETRLDTLRKVFDIDKYKRTLSNSELFITQLKEKKKEKGGQLLDLPFKQEQLKKKNEMLKELEKKLQSLVLPLSKAQQELEELKNKIKQQQQIINELTKTKVRIASVETELKEKQLQLENFKHEEKELSETIKKLKIELKPTKDFGKLKTETEISLETGRSNEKILEKKLAILESRKERLLADSEKISSLKVCPVCKQEVTVEHRKKILTEIKQELEKIKLETEKIKTNLNELKPELKKLENKLKEMIEEEKIALAMRVKFVTLEEKEARLLKAINFIANIGERIMQLDSEKKSQAETIEKYKDAEAQHEKTLEELEKRQKQEKMLLVEKAGFEQAVHDIAKEINQLKTEVEEKEKIKESLEKLQKLQNFLEKNFVTVIQLIEKQVMLKLNAEFNALFKQWFTMLVDDPGLDARTDTNFTPLIEQAGYEINYSCLSGGERTALALAYRLALNQVINSMLSKINTKSLLILDEPTDGFSSEQLDKMRNVLQELRAEQLILVSHETKIESFVQNVIRFVKQGHVSRVVK